jgi:predicted heme/steroid binding protein
MDGISSNVYLGAGVAVIAIFALRLWNASVDAQNARALAAAHERQAKAKAEKKEIRRRFFTLDELKEFDGENGKPIYIAILDEVYDVSDKRDFYGPGKSYALFAGRDVSRALALISFVTEDLESEDV